MKGNRPTPEEIEKIASLLIEGCSASAIATALGRSRNSIVGIVHRSPALKRIGFTNPAPSMYWLVKKRRKIEKVRPLAKRLQWEKPQPPDPPDSFAGVDIMALSEHHCRFPLWPDRVKTGLYCGRAKVRGSYCMAHATKAYGGQHGKAARTGPVHDGYRMVPRAGNASKRG